MPYTVAVRRRDSIGTVFDIAATITFSGNYPDEGEALATLAAECGIGAIEDIIPCGPAMAGDEETAVVVGYDRAAQKLIVFESGAANAALAEKTAAEAYPTACVADVIVRGK